MSGSRSLIHLVLALLILIWGTTWAVIRVGLEGLPPFTGVSIRFLLAGVLLVVGARLARIAPQPSDRLRRLWVIETIFGFCLSYGIVYWAEDQLVPSGLAAVLFSTFPLFVAVFAHFALPDEPLRRGSVLGLLLGLAGLAAIFSDDLGGLARPGVAVAGVVLLLSPLSGAISHVAIKKWGSGIHPVNLICVPMVATGVLMGAVALAFERHRQLSFDPRSLGALIYLSLAGTVLTFTLYYWLLERLPATKLSLITYVIPVVALAIGALFMDEAMTLRTLTGSALVIAGVAIATRTK